MSHDITNALDAGFFSDLTTPLVAGDGRRRVVQGVTSLEELRA